MMTFFVLLVITLSYIVIYCHQIPICLVCGGAPHQIQPHFASFQQKMPRKFFRRPGGAPAPTAPLLATPMQQGISPVSYAYSIFLEYTYVL